MKIDLLIIDVESYLYQACTACKKLTQLDKEGFVFGEVYDLQLGLDYIDKILRGFKEKFWCKSFVLVVGDKESNFRKDLNPSYKAHRSPKPLMYDRLLSCLQDKFQVVMLPHLEADDTCRIVYEDNKTFQGNKLIITIDKDFFTVPCTLYRDNIKDREVVTITEEDAKRNAFVQIIMGDKTDGYSGIPNFGEKKALSFVTESTTWKDIVNLYKENSLTEKDAILNYRMAHILGLKEYDLDKKEVIYAQPN